MLLRLARQPCPAENWGEEGEPIEEWATPPVARGSRPMYEMEQVPPGADPDDPDSDPILRANSLRDAGRKALFITYEIV